MEVQTQCLICESAPFEYIIIERSQESYFICSQCFGKLSQEKQKFYIEVQKFKQFCEDKSKQTTLETYINEFRKSKAEAEKKFKQFQEIIKQVDFKIQVFEDKKFNIDKLQENIVNKTIDFDKLNEFFKFLRTYQKNEDDESTYKDLQQKINFINKSLELYQYQTSKEEYDFTQIQNYVSQVSNSQGLQKYIDSVLKGQNLKETIPFCFRRLAFDKFEELKLQNYSYFGCRKDNNKNHGYGILIQHNRVQLGVFLEDSFIWGYMFVMKQLNHYAYSVGYFKDNLLNGQGYWSQQKLVAGRNEVSIYQGEMKFGMRDGHGMYQWPNETIYDGQWKQNLKHGKGKLYISKKQPQEVEYLNDNMKIQQLQLQQLPIPYPQQYPQQQPQLPLQPQVRQIQPRNIQTVAKQ